MVQTPAITEVVLENFMSYEYARIPLRRGLNLICGPNGAGKSSILLGIAVALGQTYTERSRRLSDLIRHGKEIARVSVVFEGVGRRIPRLRGEDKLIVSRYLRRDGSYWFEVNHREEPKSYVLEVMRRLGINPDNMLIIMHQHMMESFAATSPQERLRMLEEAVGLTGYREKVLSAKKRLEAVLGEEERIKEAVARAEDLLAYWEREYDKLLRWRQLVERKRALELEHAWAQVAKLEKSMESLKDRLSRIERRLEEISDRLEQRRVEVEGIQQKLWGVKADIRSKRLDYESMLAALAEARASSSLCEEFSKRVGTYPQLSDLAQEYARRAEEAAERARSIEASFSRAGAELEGLESQADELVASLIEARVDEASLMVRREFLEADANRLRREIEQGLRDLREAKARAGELGRRPSQVRAVSEVLEELRLVSSQLALMGEVSEEVERGYEEHRKRLELLREKLEKLEQDREKALAEVRKRFKVWEEQVTKVLREVEPVYNEILALVGARGFLGLSNPQDLETAGLELAVGFRGAEPRVLDPYTQSGGERSVATMAFLLALQQKVVSPFRAVDEFDVHMDPANREAMYRALISILGGEQRAQYVVITPGYVPYVDESIHVIVVQNVGGLSEARYVER